MTHFEPLNKNEFLDFSFEPINSNPISPSFEPIPTSSSVDLKHFEPISDSFISNTSNSNDQMPFQKLNVPDPPSTPEKITIEFIPNASTTTTDDSTFKKIDKSKSPFRTPKFLERLVKVEFITENTNYLNPSNTQEQNMNLMEKLNEGQINFSLTKEDDTQKISGDSLKLNGKFQKTTGEMKKISLESKKLGPDSNSIDLKSFDSLIKFVFDTDPKKVHLGYQRIGSEIERDVTEDILYPDLFLFDLPTIDPNLRPDPQPLMNSILLQNF